MKFNGLVGSMGDEKESVVIYSMGVRGDSAKLAEMKEILMNRAKRKGVDIVGIFEVEDHGDRTSTVKVNVRSRRGIV